MREVDMHECDHCAVEKDTRYISRWRNKEKTRKQIIKELGFKEDKKFYIHKNNKQQIWHKQKDYTMHIQEKGSI